MDSTTTNLSPTPVLESTLPPPFNERRVADEVQRAYWARFPEHYFADCLTIEDKAGVKRPLILNAHQKKVAQVIAQERAKGKPVRIIILKPRQTGISTITTAHLFAGVRFSGGVGMVVSKDGDSTEHIFSIVHRFYHYLPECERRLLPTDASSRKEIKFAEPHGGRLLVDTAGKKSAGHSFTIRHLMLSEVPRWPEDTTDTIAGLLNAVPDLPDTTVIIEGVANGMQGWFYDLWHKEDSEYVKVFLPWYEHAEYRRTLPCSADKYEATLEDDERRLMADFGLDLEQIEWRRYAIREKCGDDKEKFKEQYPATAREAFLASGNAFFHQPTLEAIQTSAPLRCNLEYFEDLSKRKEIRPVPNERGWLRLWKKPQLGRTYVIGADVAEGIEIEGAPAEDRHDYSSADVLDKETGEQVAHLHGKITPDEFGRQLATLGRYYNDAFIGVETNAGYGLHVITTLVDEGYPQHLLYRRQVMDETTRRPTRKLGWQTTKSNRRELMSQLDMALRRHECFVSCSETVDECRAFVVKPDGRIEAGAGKKDDRVFSLAIANKMREVAPVFNLSKPDGAPATVFSVYRKSVFPWSKRVNASV